MNIPPEARLDPEIRRALDALVKGGYYAPGMARLNDPAVAANNKALMQRAQAWVVGTSIETVRDGDGGERSVVKENADCLECGVCCQQGWQVDVKPSDMERMSKETLTTYMVTAPTKLRIIDGRCAAQTTHVVDGLARGCGIYEERPEVCRTFPKGHERCVIARVERGLPITPTKQPCCERFPSCSCDLSDGAFI